MRSGTERDPIHGYDDAIAAAERRGEARALRRTAKKFWAVGLARTARETERSADTLEFSARPQTPTIKRHREGMENMTTINSRDGASVEFDAGVWIERAAVDLLALANAEVKQMRGEFNGVTMTANPGETVTDILSRYSADRAEVQRPAAERKLARERAEEVLRIRHQQELWELTDWHLTRIVESGELR